VTTFDDHESISNTFSNDSPKCHMTNRNLFPMYKKPNH